MTTQESAPPPPMGKRIVFTGSSGKAGRYAIPELLKAGYKVLNLDLTPLDHADVFTLKTDLTDYGQVAGGLTSHFDFSSYSSPTPPSPPDAVIHFAAYARNLLVPDAETFRGNALSTYNVIEAACKLGVRARRAQDRHRQLRDDVRGVCFAQGADPQYRSFPLDEDGYDCDPEDTYALSKLCGERVARGFARRFAVDVYALRIGNVVEPHEYARDFPRYLADPSLRKRNAWSYVDARDLGRICDLCVRRDGLGFQVFDATNDGITATAPTERFLKTWCPDTPISRAMGEWEGPLSNRKIKEVLGFKEEQGWRKYVKA